MDSWLAEAAGYGTVDVVPPTETVLAETEIAHLPRRPCLAPGRTVLWRAPDCVQLGLSGPHAMVLDGLTAPMAALLRGMDGSRDIIHLIGEAATAGADPTEALAVITELHRAGLVRDEPAPRYCERTALDIDLAAGSVHSGQSTLELVRVRRSASVLVRGSGRVAVALAVALATAGLGRVVVAAEGTVQASDLGTGYLPSDVGRERADAARDALRRAARGVRTEPAGARSSPDLVVVTDAVVPDPDVALDLVVRRRPHLAVYAQESVAAVGPLVLPGRSSCLRCVELQRADADPAWPKLAAQLASAASNAGLACTQLAAALAVEQVLAALAGPEAASRSLTWGASLELDPLRGVLHRRPWPIHPRCGCRVLE
ncbi:MAG: ThiF family adenylyltransferase [Actinomycetota bacterium]|nr:ThiF family adenylyltransferase [Actinomycetota bacterium]